MSKPKKAKKGVVGWLKEAALLLLLVVVAGWGMDLWRSQSMAAGQAPVLQGVTVQGEEVDLLTLSQEKPVLVYFWATWCVICDYVSPSVDYFDDSYQVLTVALSSGENQRIQHYLNAKGYDFSVLNDPKSAIGKQWGVSATPTLFIIDKGQVSSVTTGFTSPIGIWLRLLIA